MTLQSKIEQLDSLERIEMEMELEKRLEKKKEEAFRREIRSCSVSSEINVDKLIDLLDKRYQKAFQSYKP